MLPRINKMMQVREKIPIAATLLGKEHNAAHGGANVIPHEQLELVESVYVAAALQVLAYRAVVRVQLRLLPLHTEHEINEHIEQATPHSGHKQTLNKYVRAALAVQNVLQGLLHEAVPLVKGDQQRVVAIRLQVEHGLIQLNIVHHTVAVRVDFRLG